MEEKGDEYAEGGEGSISQGYAVNIADISQLIIEEVFEGNLKEDIYLFINKSSAEKSKVVLQVRKTLNRLKELDLVESQSISSNQFSSNVYQVTNYGMKKKTEDMFPSKDLKRFLLITYTSRGGVHAYVAHSNTRVEYAKIRYNSASTYADKEEEDEDEDEESDSQEESEEDEEEEQEVDYEDEVVMEVEVEAPETIMPLSNMNIRTSGRRTNSIYGKNGISSMLNGVTCQLSESAIPQKKKIAKYKDSLWQSKKSHIDYEQHNDELLDKFLTSVSDLSEDFPRKLPETSRRYRATLPPLICGDDDEYSKRREVEGTESDEEMCIASKVLWQPCNTEQECMLEAMLAQCKAIVCLPGSIIQVDLKSQCCTFCCVLGPYLDQKEVTASESEQFMKEGKDVHVEDEIYGMKQTVDLVVNDVMFKGDNAIKKGTHTKLVVFDGMKNIIVPISACLPLVSEDTLINILHDLSSSDIEDITPRLLKVAADALEKQWSVQEITEYLRMLNAKSNNLTTLYSKSLLPKTRTKGELIRLHEYFMPLTIVRNGTSSYNKLLRLFQRAEVCIFGLSQSLDNISDSSRRKIVRYGNVRYASTEQSMHPNLSASNIACIPSIETLPSFTTGMAQRKLSDRKAEIIRLGKVVINLIKVYRSVNNPTYLLLPKLMPYLKNIGWKKVMDIQQQDVYLAPWIAMSVDEGGVILKSGDCDLQSTTKPMTKSSKTKTAKKLIIPKLNRDYFLFSKDLLKYLCDAAALSSDESEEVVMEEMSTSSKEGNANTFDVKFLNDDDLDGLKNSRVALQSDNDRVSSSLMNIHCGAPDILISSISYNEQEASVDDHSNISIFLRDGNIASTGIELGDDSGHFVIHDSAIEVEMDPLSSCTTTLLDGMSDGIGSFNIPLASTLDDNSISDDNSSGIFPVSNSAALSPSPLLVDTLLFFQRGSHLSDKIDSYHCTKEKSMDFNANGIDDTLRLGFSSSLAEKKSNEANEMISNCYNKHIDDVLISSKSIPSTIDCCDNEDQISTDVFSNYRDGLLSNIEGGSSHNIFSGNSVDLEKEATDISMYPENSSIFPVNGSSRSEEQGYSSIDNTFSVNHSKLLATFNSLTSSTSGDILDSNFEDTLLSQEDSSSISLLCIKHPIDPDLDKSEDITKKSDHDNTQLLREIFVDSDDDYDDDVDGVDYAQYSKFKNADVDSDNNNVPPSSSSSNSSSSYFCPSSVIPSATVEEVDQASPGGILTRRTATKVEAEVDAEESPPSMHGYDLLCFGAHSM
jgi:hypothetical protein